MKNSLSKRSGAFGAIALALACATFAPPARAADPPPDTPDAVTHHTITLGGKPLAYTARAGTITLRGPDEAPTAKIFYTAYTVDGATNRPVTFLYNGGPGSSTMWLHMGSFAPVRVVTANGTMTGPPPYQVIPNDKTLLDKTDLVFIDMPNTGFGRVVPGKEKQFFGLDNDANAFAQFVERYVTTFGRWNSPKFLYGESYGTTRSAALVSDLEQNGIGVNGVVLQSVILNFGLDDLTTSGGGDWGYMLYLPTEAAVAWYHNAVPNRAARIEDVVADAKAFAIGEYSDALSKGANVPLPEFKEVAAKLARLTGLPQDYIEKSNLRVPYYKFEGKLFQNRGEIVGRLDARFKTGTWDRYADFPFWDPTDAAIDSAFTSAINNYLRTDLQYQPALLYKTSTYNEIQAAGGWDFKHNGITQPDVSPDLAQAMIYNPDLKVFVANGYYDFATPFYETVFTMDHLNISPALRQNISFGFYPSGHMIYLQPDAFNQLHDDLERWYDTALGGH
jgi:carboxypeptidase C (cathepsin A)